MPEVLDRILSRMLARDPRDRYQTAIDLIVALERTELAAAVPSFVNPELASQDPQVRASLTSSVQPTRLDLNAPSSRQHLTAGDPEVWYLRYRNTEGQWRKARLTTQQVRKRLNEGRMPPSVEASRQRQGEFRPLRSLPEFRAFAAAAQRGPATAVPAR